MDDEVELRRQRAHLHGHSVDRSGGENIDIWDGLIGDAEDAGGCHECEQGQEEIAVLTQGVEHAAKYNFNVGFKNNSWLTPIKLA